LTFAARVALADGLFVLVAAILAFWAASAGRAAESRDRSSPPPGRTPSAVCPSS